jgi:hypothetical protein
LRCVQQQQKKTFIVIISRHYDNRDEQDFAVWEALAATPNQLQPPNCCQVTLKFCFSQQLGETKI